MQRTILLGLLFFLLPLPAHAALNLCNRTSYILYAATSAVGGNAGLTQGWTRLAPGDCQTAIKTSLSGQSILVYARSALAHSGPQRAWGGNFPTCVHDGNFMLRQAVPASACREDSFSAPFAAIDTKGRADWTMNLDEQPAYPSLTAAQLAGVKRLLKDNGFATGTIDGLPDKATGKSLKAFRDRMHFTPSAGNDALFAALEAGALKSTAPAGYTVCNDGAENLLVAMGEVAGKAPVSRGWWPIAPGACARTITTPLAGDAAYLLAQKRSGVAVVSGSDKFCVTPQEFEIQGRANCAARGYVEAGFARTATKSSSGYVAHIGGNGLVPHAAMSK
jgi:uncharacterized membrane protein